ncbi:MAG: PAS domain S-box protein, partial [Desulfobacterales bacterium]|nr:PAS domain S-box protein [Desulfobacterales bacterium]
MSFRPLLSLRHSVATRLLSYVFSVYLLVSVIITIVHMVSEYRRVEENVIQDLIIFYRYANPTVAVALWEADREQIDSILNGFVKSPTITGIKISDLSGEFVRTNGKIIEDDNTRSFPRKTDSNILIKARDTELFGFQFPIIYAGEQGDHNIGSISLYSSPAVIFSRVKSSYIFIVVNAIIKTIVLWVIFLWFSRFLLRRPLAILTNAAEDIDMENLEKIRINTGSKYKDEIKILETAFNRMVEKLRDARDTNARIKEKQKSRLAKQVKKRTRELSDSEERYRRLVERAPFGIAIHQTGDIVFINGAGKKILGMPDVSTDGTAGEDRAYVTGLLNQIIHKLNLVSADKDPLDHRIEEQFTRSDGSSVDLSVEGIEFSFKGTPAVHVVFQDI